jgi:hypothetical protein
MPQSGHSKDTCAGGRVPVADLRASVSSGLEGIRVRRWSGWGQYAFCLINAALRLISGDGELEKGWKRLLGSSRGRSDVSMLWVEARPGWDAISGDSFLTACPCCPNVDADLQLISFRRVDCVAFRTATTIALLPFCVDIVLLLESKDIRCDEGKVDDDGRCDLFKALKHLWHVYEAEERIIVIAYALRSYVVGVKDIQRGSYEIATT